MLELVALSSDPDAASALAERIGGRLYLNHGRERDDRPYSAVVRGATDDLAACTAAADVGLHVCYARAVKPEEPTPAAGRVIASFGLVGPSQMSHEAVDAHWRDVHAPLALRSHSAMCDYTQISVLATLSGTPIDGIAMCAFRSREELSDRFFDDDAAKQAILDDVAQFSDPHRSLRRVVLVEQ
ncbi:MAG: EthD domain-containing protein [Actinomycetota bacterium]